MNPYLLIHEDGTIQSVSEWGEEFEAAIEDGVLEVIRFNDGVFERYNQGWESV
jgi:hypothetical protein